MKIISLSIVMLVALFALGTQGSSANLSPSIDPAPVSVEAPAAEEETAIGAQCGGVVCGKGQWCCNASCSRCVPVGVGCPQVACFAPDLEPELEL